MNPTWKMKNPCTSQNITTDLVDQVVADHDVDILKMKEDVQEMWKNVLPKEIEDLWHQRRLLAFLYMGTTLVSLVF